MKGSHWLSIIDDFLGPWMGGCGGHGFFLCISDLGASEVVPAIVRRWCSSLDCLVDAGQHCPDMAAEPRCFIHKPCSSIWATNFSSGKFPTRFRAIPARCYRRHCFLLLRSLECKTFLLGLFQTADAKSKRTEDSVVDCSVHNSCFVLCGLGYHSISLPSFVISVHSRWGRGWLDLSTLANSFAEHCSQPSAIEYTKVTLRGNMIIDVVSDVISLYSQYSPECPWEKPHQPDHVQ